jgi:predicted Zn-dependent protease
LGEIFLNRALVMLLCVIALALGWVAYTRSSTQPAGASASLAPQIEGSKIYFVPIGDFPAKQIQPLVQYYREKYNLEITVLSSIPVDPATRDEARGQLMAEDLVASVRRGAPEYATDPKAILIGFTSEDIYPTSQHWRFAFGWRTANARAAVVSTARMSLPYTGESLSVNVPETRLRKMVTKDIGILYYGLPQSQNPKSVLYNSILGIEELDQVGEDF